MQRMVDTCLKRGNRPENKSSRLQRLLLTPLECPWGLQHVAKQTHSCAQNSSMWSFGIIPYYYIGIYSRAKCGHLLGKPNTL